MKPSVIQFLFGSSIGNNRLLNIGYLLFRLHIGLSMAIHAGFPKMKDILAPGWFAEQVAGLGFTFPSPQFWAMAASWGEFVGGLMIALGLLTRVASIQLAFQFLVIAFLWYDKPEFLTGMYFQQLYFWCFLFCSVAGSGSYSLDALILKKYRPSAKPLAHAALAVVMLLAGSCTAHGQQPAIQQQDLKKLEGKWRGELTYKDYQSGKQELIPCSLTVTLQDDKTLLMAYQYPGEGSHDGTDTLTISADRTIISGVKLASRTVDANGLVQLIVDYDGEDDDKPARIRKVIEIGNASLIITKMVQFGNDAPFQRNRYSWKR